ncbi:PLD nuclease N-terminal domain-containing protein [Demequina sediminicola]|uniref:PLD nuclease N-terminal domain-containing protein n=1 Tax=Demequina sediminicola TaxID=1095026 RepID=UPI000781B20D|nr:PLD nuclease N-terminal domain-containing protein [Demequina sediminicola]
MISEVSPLLPTTYDVAWTVVAVATLAFAVVALVSVARRASLMSSSAVALWCLLILVVPVVGPVMWFVAGKRARPATVS